MRAFLAVLVGLVAWILSLFVIGIINDSQPVPHGGLLAVIIGIFAGVAWYLWGRYPGRPVV